MKNFYSLIKKKNYYTTPSSSHSKSTNKKRKFQYDSTAINLLLYNKKIPWQKKCTNFFDLAMGAYDGAVSELECK